jgi:hypothetical protein
MLGWFRRSRNNKEDEENYKIEKPIFLVGCGRSGTSILFDIFEEHPQLSPTTGYPDGEDHVGWVEHGKCLISGFGYAHINRGMTGHLYCLYMDEADVTEEIIKSMSSYYYKDVLFQDLSKRVVTKCPHLSNKLRYVRGIFPDAKFVHIVRDCVPVVGAWIDIMENQAYTVFYLPETEFPCIWVLPAPQDGNRESHFSKETRFYPGNIHILADYWEIVNKNIPLQLSDSANQLLTIKYEDLCANPLKVINSICDFCEINPFSEVPVEVVKDFNAKDANHVPEDHLEDILAKVNETRRLFGYVQP